MRRRAQRIITSLIFGAVLLGFASGARADDLADEADFQFRLGISRYEARDYEGALEHFLVSNRLVTNRNVLFNIGRTYEQLRRMPEAYRYYTLARDAETDASVQKSIDDAIGRVAPSVAVLRVTTTPPGATIYLDRKELGPRGTAPRKIGVGEGSYRVIAELPGYEPATSDKISAPVGRETKVELTLKRLVASLAVEGEPVGAVVHVDSEQGEAIGTVGTRFVAPAGKHTLFVTKRGYQTATTPVDLPVNGQGSVRVQLAPITGQVVVESDIRDAVILVDGKESGFTPAVLNVPAGAHVIRVSQPGFRPVERAVEVSPTQPVKVYADLTNLEEVSGASRVVETVEEAPASITIISGQELRAMGYPTIAEAVRGVRGIYLSDDRSYVSIGVRGFSRPDNYGNRILILVDGHPANDNYVWSSYVGVDGRVDIDDIDRIEVIRGPGSVVYGTSAFFGVINLITRDRETAKTSAETAIGTYEYGVVRGRATGIVRLGARAGFWTTVSGARGSGRDFYFPEYDVDPRGPVDPATGQRGEPLKNGQGLPSNGVARDVDGFDAGMITGRAWWRDFTVQWFLNSRKKKLPSGTVGTIFADSRNHYADTRGFIEARFEPKIGADWQSLTRAHVDMYDFDSLGAYPPPSVDPESGGMSHETFRGRWVGFEQRVIYSPATSRFMLGAAVQRHIRAEQRGDDDFGPYILGDQKQPSRDDPFTSAGAYALADVGINKRVRLSAGARFDYFSNLQKLDPLRATSPRIAVILKPYDAGLVKIMAGKAFRTPSIYEFFYSAPDQQERAPSTLQPEQIYSGEVELTHRFSSAVTGTIAGYANELTDLIELNPIQKGTGIAGADITQYQNSQAPVLIVGGEVEVRHDWRQGLFMSASYSLQRGKYLNTEFRREVPNAPKHLGALKFATPILGKALGLMSRFSMEGPRYDVNFFTTEPPQGQTDWGFVWDLVFSGAIERFNARWNVGAYNLADSRYQSVTSREFAQRTMPQNGRTILATLTLTFQ